MLSPPSSCSVYEDASVVNFVFSVLITVGIFVSYVPQYARIYAKRTSEGLSTNFLLLGSCSSIFTLTNIVLVSSTARACCSLGQLTTFNCINSQLNLIQIGVQCTCAIMILVLVLVLTRYSTKQDKHEYHRITVVGKLVVLHGAVLLAEIGLAYVTSSAVLMLIANVNGLLSTLLTVVKYVPQIWTTYSLKHPGTLSIGMMCIQTPGGFIFTATLYFTKGSHWSLWISYLFAALLQGSLLALCVYYEYFGDADDAEARVIGDIVEHNIEEEREALLPNRDSPQS